VGMVGMEAQGRAIFGRGLTNAPKEKVVASMVDIFLTGIQRRA
jgi:hypothetical protein